MAWYSRHCESASLCQPRYCGIVLNHSVNCPLIACIRRRNIFFESSYRDAGHYYYFTHRNNNTIALRKLVNNAIVELDSAPLTVAANTWYRTRFEAVSTQLRVYINDSLVLEATDASHDEGRYGPVMYRAGVEYDDILAVEP